MFKEFKKFISRGNVLDMAVGIIIGSAFTAIVSSAVNDIIMPLIGIISGGIDFTNLSFTIGGAVVKYGSFIQNIIDFLIVAFCLFMTIRFMNKLTHIRKKQEQEKEKEVIPKDIELLTEIRDLLKKEKKKNK